MRARAQRITQWKRSISFLLSKSIFEIVFVRWKRSRENYINCEKTNLWNRIHSSPSSNRRFSIVLFFPFTLAIVSFCLIFIARRSMRYKMLVKLNLAPYNSIMEYVWNHAFNASNFPIQTMSPSLNTNGSILHCSASITNSNFQSSIIKSIKSTIWFSESAHSQSISILLASVFLFSLLSRIENFLLNYE